MWWNRCLDVALTFPVSVGTLSLVTASGDLATENWPPSKCFQAVCDSQHPECWESYFPSWKERHPQKVCLHASLLQELFSFKDMRYPGLRRGPKLQSGPGVSLHLMRLTNTFHTTHEEAGCRRVSESDGCHTVVNSSKWHYTANRLEARSSELPPCFRNPKR